MKNKLPLIVIFGRTNVGKSTLFNCLTESKKALTSPIEGTTRDSNLAEISWRDAKFTLVDTGGIIDLKNLSDKLSSEDAQDLIDQEVQKQARKMLLQADIILFLVDTKSGMLPQDKELSVYLKKNIKKIDKIVLVANKADSSRLREKIAEFYQLSLGEPQAVSAASGSGTGDLLDLIVQKLKKSKNFKPADKNEDNSQFIRVCILGKPNVGKSSLFNNIIGEKRVIVSPLPHTTREPQDTNISYAGQPVKLIDTAGLSREGLKRNPRIKNTSLEKMGIDRSMQTLERSDIVIFVMDITEPLTHQDSKIIEEIIGRRKSLIILANKWDLAPEKDTKKFTEYIYSKLPFITWAPIQFVSALTGEKIKKVMDLVLRVNKQRNIEITEARLKEFILKITRHHKPTKSKGFKRPYLHKLVQTQTNPPKFELTIGAHDNLSESYVRFIENQLREQFDIIGTPLSIYVGKKKRVYGQGEDNA